MTNRASLTGRTATGDVHAGVELVRGLRGVERLVDLAAENLGREIILKRPSVDADLAGAGSETDTSHGGLATVATNSVTFDAAMGQ